MKGWIKSLHNWSLQWANTKWGPWALFFCAFADASFLPLPTPMFFIALTLLNIKKAYKYALFGTLGTFAGAVAGYAIGHFAWLDANGNFTSLAQFVLGNVPGFSETIYTSIQTMFEKWDFWILFIASFIPVPYKIFSISSGVFDVNLFMFSLATLVSQGIKFFFVSLLVIKIGPEIIKILEFKWKPIIIITTTCIVIGLIVINAFQNGINV